MVSFTVAQALELNALRDARVVAGQRGLGRAIRWVAVIEVPEVPRWLHGGELLLTTGLSWPNEPDGQRSLVDHLAGINLAGIILALGEYWKDVPEAIVQAADHWDLPVLTIPWEVPFVDVTEAIHSAILRFQYQLFERSEAVHRALTTAAVEAGDLQHIVAVLSNLIQKSVTFVDGEMRLLAHSTWGDETDVVTEAVTSRGRVPTSVIRHLQEQGVSGRLRSATRAVQLAACPDLGMAVRVVCPIRTSGDLVGYVWILERSQEYLELDARAAEHAATVAALHILRQQAISGAEARVRASFVDALIAGEVPANSGGYRERARLMGFDPETPHAVLLASLLHGRLPRRRALSNREEFARRERLERALRAVIAEAKLPVLTTCSLNRVVAVLPGHTGRSGLRQTVERLQRRITELEPAQRVTFAVGALHAGFEGIQVSFREADAAASLVNSETSTAWFEDLLVTRILYEGGHSGTLLELYTSTLGRLFTVRNGGSLYETLAGFAASGFDKAETARTLCVHRNTLDYRLRTIERLLETRLADPALRLKVALAFEAEKVLRLRGELPSVAAQIDR